MKEVLEGSSVLAFGESRGGSSLKSPCPGGTMHTQRNLSIVVGTAVGIIIYILFTFLHTDGLLQFYASLRFGAIFLIIFSCLIAGRFFILIQVLTIIYEKIRYTGNRPHREIQVANDESLFLAITIPVLITLTTILLVGFSERLICSLLAATLVVRVLKMILMSITGYKCRFLYPISFKSYYMVNIFPEPELNAYWRPIEVFAFGAIITILLVTIPIFQNITIRFFTFADPALRSLGI